MNKRIFVNKCPRYYQKVGLNRQTFYYHFTDKYDLLRWIYRHDALIYFRNRYLFGKLGGTSPEVKSD